MITRNPELIIVSPSLRTNTSTYRLYDALRNRGVRVRRALAHRPPRYNTDSVRAMLWYGTTEHVDWLPQLNQTWLFNSPGAVAISSSKTHMFSCLSLQDVPTVPWTVDRREAMSWVENGKTVIARHLTRASQGRGIEIVWPEDGIVVPTAPLYTEMIRAKLLREYRVYVVWNEAVAVAEKRRWNSERLREEGIDPDDPVARRIRSHANGWVFARNEISATPEQIEVLKRVALDAAQAVGLYFCGVDIIATRTGELYTPYVVETNSAIGLNDSNIIADVADGFVRALRRV